MLASAVFVLVASVPLLVQAAEALPAVLVAVLALGVWLWRERPWKGRKKHE